MPRAIVSDGQPGFGGGIDSATAQGVSPEPTRFASLVNARVLPSGEVAKRPGFKVLNSTSSLVNGWSWADPNTGQSIVLFDGTNIRTCTFNPTTGVITVNATVPCTALPSPNGFAHFRGPTDEGLYINSRNSSAKAVFWNGTAVTTLGAGTPGDVRSLWVYNQRLFGVALDSQTLYWSALNNGHTLGDTANGGGFATIRSFGGQYIATGGAVGNSNYIIHRGAVSVFRGLSFDDIAITAGTQGVSPDVGGLDEGSFRVIDGVGYLVSQRGLMLVSESGITPYQLSTGQRDPLAEIVASSAFVSNVSIADNVRAGEVWIACLAQPSSGASSVQRVFIYNKMRQRFTGDVTLANTNNTIANFFASGKASAGNVAPQMMGVASYAGGTALVACDFQNTALEVFTDFGGTAAATNYTSSVRCHRFFTSSESSSKSWRWGIVRMGAGALGTATPGSATGATLTSVIGGTTVASTDALPAMQASYVGLGGSGQSCDVTITDSGTSTTGWSVARVDAQGFDMGMR